MGTLHNIERKILDIDTRVGTPHMKMCSDVQSRVGTPHIKMCSDDHTRVGTPHMKTRVGTPHKILRKSLALSVAEAMWWGVGCGGYVVGGGPSQRIMPLCGSILEAGTCQILS